MSDRPMKGSDASSERRPWTSGPEEILQHGLDLLEQDTDTSRRLAMLNIDNAVEVIGRTYLELPERFTGVQMSLAKYEEVSRSFPKLIDALDQHASDRLVGIALEEIEWFHQKRNQLYHNGNGLTIEREKVQVYAQLARNLFRALFGYEVLPTRPERDPVASFLSQWAAIESVSATLLNRKGLSVRVGDSYPAVGGGTLLRALGAAGLISEEQLRELMELREVRQRLVEFDSEDPPKIDREMIDRLKKARRTIESQIEVS